MEGLKSPIMFCCLCAVGVISLHFLTWRLNSKLEEISLKVEEFPYKPAVTKPFVPIG